ncbi:hypothetical protein [Gilliamella sp. Pas-s25]|uniref:hypothetical protein n=1 Tax=Gilliamella sp. Pas-s25 TaxID=2687310 RepID=UPI00135D6CCC|nr:hypothetical protein [Gilliamella sp. Pas-s25]MWP61770.1 hypothetical protein [Gilliamella sp. Pas-s25]
MLGLLLLSSSWNVQAQAGNRSDAIMIPADPIVLFATPTLSPYYIYNEGVNDLKPEPTAPEFVYNTGFFAQPHPLYAFNFPTTGADGVFFDLVLEENANDLTWQSDAHEGITATVTNIPRSDSWFYEACSTLESFIPSCSTRTVLEKSTFIRVILTGPSANYTQKNSNNPSLVHRPHLPQTFELVGRNRHGAEVVKYGFVLKQWFVHRGDKTGNQSEQAAWCNAIGYRMPRVKELTNAKCGVGNPRYDDFPCRNGIDGASPQSRKNSLQRNIGAGFVTEWGTLTMYRSADFARRSEYWTSDSDFFVESDNGRVKNLNSSWVSSSNYGICVYP